MNRIRCFILSLAIVVIGVSGFGLSVNAQEKKEGIGISPTTLTLEADAGQEITGEVTVINPGDEPVNYRLYASNFRVRNEEYEKDFDITDIETAEPVSWFRLPEEPKQLAANGQEKVKYTIQVPNNVASQGYYGVIFAETMSEKPDESGVTRRKRVGSLVYLTVKGAAINRQARLTSFEVLRWQRHSPVKASVRLTNEGNVHFQAKGQIRLKNLWGKPVHETSIDATVLPNTTRKVSVELPTTRAVGLYRVEGQVSMLDQSSELESHWVIVATPVWLSLWLIVLVILIVVGFALKRRHKGRSVK